MSFKLVKFIHSAMKAVKNPEFIANLEGFHKGLILHLQYLEARQADGTLDDFQVSFLAASRQYLDFLKSMGADLEMPVNQPKTTAAEVAKL